MSAKGAGCLCCPCFLGQFGWRQANAWLIGRRFFHYRPFDGNLVARSLPVAAREENGWRQRHLSPRLAGILCHGRQREMHSSGKSDLTPPLLARKNSPFSNRDVELVRTDERKAEARRQRERTGFGNFFERRRCRGGG